MQQNMHQLYDKFLDKLFNCYFHGLTIAGPPQQAHMLVQHVHHFSTHASSTRTPFQSVESLWIIVSVDSLVWQAFILQQHSHPTVFCQNQM